jgi:hypothetical protein
MASPHNTSQYIREKVRAIAHAVFESTRATLSFLRAYVAARTNLMSADERGEIASWVVVTALVVAASIVIVAIITTKLTNTANNIQTP